MIKKLKISFLVLAMALFVGSSFAEAAAGDLTWSADQTLDMTSPDVDLTIVSGSTAESLVVNAGTLVPTLASGDVFTVSTISAGSFAVTPVTGVSINCNSSTIATVVITATGSQAYTITPSATACDYQASGGGGSYTPPVVVTLTPTVTTTTETSVTTTVPTVVTTTPANDAGCVGGAMYSVTTGAMCGGSSSSSATTTPMYYDFGTGVVKQGSKGDTCMAWQSFLNNAINAGLVVDGNCGPKTIAAAKSWQSSVGITADGMLGAQSRAKAMNGNSMMMTDTSSSMSSSYNFGTSLVKEGSKGDACKAWQMFLNDHMNAGLTVDGWCGAMTIAAAKSWQSSVGITADGILGAQSRAKAMEMM